MTSKENESIIKKNHEEKLRHRSLSEFYKTLKELTPTLHTLEKDKRGYFLAHTKRLLLSEPKSKTLQKDPRKQQANIPYESINTKNTILARCCDSSLQS
jgi:hypothetical protein